MRQIEKAIIICIILCIVKMLPRLATIVSYYFLDYSFAQESSLIYAFTIFSRVSCIAAYLAIGIWLFNLARHEKANHWIWLLFGFFFGPITAVLFFLWKAFTSAKPAETIAEA